MNVKKEDWTAKPMRDVEKKGEVQKQPTLRDTPSGPPDLETKRTTAQPRQDERS